MPEQLIGDVSHFYGKLGVMIVDTSKPIETGQTIRVKGRTSDFETTIRSMQYNHEEIQKAKKGMSIGIEIPYKAREGDEVYLLT